MSTADSAGRPVRPPASSTGSARRAPYADGGTAGGRVTDRAEGSALRRMARTETRVGLRADDPRAGEPHRARSPLDGAARRGRRVRRPTAASTPWRARAPVPRVPPPRPASARRVRLTVSRVDPWSAMKISFLLSVALGIAGVVMVFVLWTILAGMGVFDQINGIVGQVVQDGQQRFDIMDFIGLGRVVSLSIVIAVIDVILVTAIATLGAFLYNVSSALVGGVQLTLTDD